MKDIRLNKRFGVQFAYLFDCIDYCVADASELTDREKIEFVFEDFYRTANYPCNLQCFPNEQDRLEDWLRGLPSSCSVDIYPNSIINIGKSWGFCQTERKAANFVNNWFSVLAFRLIQMREILCK